MNKSVAPRKKLGGDLGFYTITMILGSIFTFMNMEYLTYPLRSLNVFLYFSPFILTAIILFYLITLRRGAIIMNLIYLWIVPVLWIRSFFLIDYGLGGIWVIVYATASMAWTIIWTVYFLASKRMKELFGK